MALRDKRQSDLRRLAFVLATVGAVATLSAPAAAQFWGERNSYGRTAPSRDYFSDPFFNPFRQAPPAEPSKPPPPRKLETTPTSTVVVIGDSLADWLAYGLEETYADNPDIGIERKIRATSGLIRYDSKNESLEWSDAVKDALAAEKPRAIVVMLGLNDRVPFRDRTPPRPGLRNATEPGQNVPQGQGPAPAQPQSETRINEQPSIIANEAQRPGPNGGYEFHS